jgi:ribosomal protein S18 acetylase RimI-like enzyme
MPLKFRKAVKEDAELLLDIYNAAFFDDYVKYGECPGYGMSKEKMESSILYFTKYIVMYNDTSVGVISFEHKDSGFYYLSCLCIIPSYQGKSLGTQAFQYMLSVCTDWKKIVLVTPADKIANIQFYTEKCGFLQGKENWMVM